MFDPVGGPHCQDPWIPPSLWLTQSAAARSLCPPRHITPRACGHYDNSSSRTLPVRYPL